MSARPHHVGSPYDKDNAEWLLARFKEFGWDAEIETFSVLFPTPKERVLELLEPTRFTAKLEESALSIDPTSDQKSEQLPVYNAYSIDGDVTGPLVYVNYGRPEDYEVLERYGISVKGAIVIARYGESWRGIKPKVAAEHGAIGCLIYLGSERRWLRGRRGLSERPDASVRRRAARQRDGHADLSRRSAHAGRRRDTGSKATRAQGCDDADEDSGDADLVRRRPAAAGVADRRRRAGRMARRTADHVSLRPGAAAPT